ncbi:Putative isochorismatase [Colletotrichum destructivum]|uniref:Isochorismatase n=1 Tax=Colletotrichum destructivum TaxID=34406 RepID=A0AAX4IQH5_9PEZI|nr:Putative isochorismatase [Colletotrichum destructivum]
MELIDNIVATLLENKDYLPHVSCAVTAAHEKSIPVIHITIDFRRNYPEVPRMNPFWAHFVDRRLRPRQGPAKPRPQFVPEATPLPRRDRCLKETHLGIWQQRSGGPSGIDGVRNLVMAGVTTNGVVLSTVRETMDKYYGITVLEDLCVDSDEEVRRALNTKGFPVSGAVMKWEDWVANL